MHHVQLFIWQRDIVGPAQCIKGSSGVLDALEMLRSILMMHYPHLHEPWRLGRCTAFIITKMSSFLVQTLHIFQVGFISLWPELKGTGMHAHRLLLVANGFVCTSPSFTCTICVQTS